MTHAYLDNNATTQPDAAVVDAVTEAMRRHWANPSSMHRPGQAARNQIERAREQVGRLIGCRTRQLIFTSGATESNNLALRGLVEARAPRRTIITTRLEHSAVREPCDYLESQGYTVRYLPAGVTGRVDAEALEPLLDEHEDETALVAVHWVNNETGVIQPIEMLGEVCRSHGVPLFTDATQAVGKLVMNVGELPIDVLSFSAHKFHGPMGVGGLYVHRRVKLTPQQRGGPHERERRAGTENTFGIIGMGVAAELAQQFLDANALDRLRAMRDRLETRVTDAVDNTIVIGRDAPRLWNTSTIAFPPLEAEAILLLLSERGVSAAAGAACSSGSLEPSPVLLAMGLDEPVAHAAVRFSIGRFTTDDEIDYALRVIPDAVAKLRRSLPQ